MARTKQTARKLSGEKAPQVRKIIPVLVQDTPKKQPNKRAYIKKKKTTFADEVEPQYTPFNIHVNRNVVSSTDIQVAHLWYNNRTGAQPEPAIQAINSKSTDELLEFRILLRGESGLWLFIGEYAIDFQLLPHIMMSCTKLAVRYMLQGLFSTYMSTPMVLRQQCTEKVLIGDMKCNASPRLFENM